MGCCDNQTLIFPEKVIAGLSFRAVASKAGIVAPDWSMTLVIRGPSKIDIDGEDVGTRFVFSADDEETAAWQAGKHWYSLRAVNGGETEEIASGELTIIADMATADAGFDGSTENEKALAAINAVLKNRATIDQNRYKINNRELWRTPIADLMKLRGMYVSLVNSERSGNGRFGRKIPVRFS